MGTDEEAYEFLAGLEERMRPLEEEFFSAAWEAAAAGASVFDRTKRYAGVVLSLAKNAVHNARESRSLSIDWEVNAPLAEQEIFDTLESYSRQEFDDPLLTRQIKMLYDGALAKRESLSLAKRAHEASTEGLLFLLYSSFRGRIDRKKVKQNDINEILKKSDDQELRRKAWEASKQIGRKAVPRLRMLVRMRNEAARKSGFSNFYEKALSYHEMDVDQLFSLLDELEETVRPVFNEAKAGIDARLAERFGIPVDELMPWHYSDHFFQGYKSGEDVDLDQFYADKDIVELTRQFFTGIGMDIDDMLAKSDLYERKGKQQSAFMMHLDRDGDIRLFANIRPDKGWMGTMLHEAGHGVDYKYISPDLPYFLRDNKSVTTEAMGMLFGEQSTEPEFLEELLGVEPEVVAEIVPLLREHQRLGKLIFTQWVQVMARFERAMYEEPEQDLNSLWWGLVEKYQGLKKPEGRDAPDYAAKMHIVLNPGMYHNYLLGNMIAAQLTNRIRSWTGKSLVNNPEAGKYLIDRYFSLGQSLDWNGLMEHATGEPLNPRYFVEECKKKDR